MGLLNNSADSENRRPIPERIRRTEERIATLDDILRDTRRGLALLPVVPGQELKTHR